MEFAFTEEQQMIQSTAESFFADVSGSEAVRAAMATEQGYDNALWQSLCEELYLQAITVPEDFGGMGLGVVELVAVMEQMGRFVVCAPYFSTVCLSSTAVLLAGDQSQQEQFFTEVLAGKTAAFALTSNGQWDASAISARYEKQGDNYILDGDYRYVIDGHTADYLIVAAQGEQGLALFLLTSDQAGITRTWLPTVDQTRKQAQISLQQVSVSADALLQDQAEQVFSDVLDIAAICLAAEQVGGASEVLEKTVTYTKERVQFNRPVASFQSVKHQAADMMTRAEAARSAVYYAACIAQEKLEGGPLAGELKEAASIAKANASEAYFKNAGDAIQLHGGVGFTWEYDVHLYFKRAKASEHYLGNAVYHRERLAQLLLDGE